MVVICEKRRLIESQRGLFVNSEHFKVLRTGLALEKSFVEAENKACGISGIFYAFEEVEEAEEIKDGLQNKEALKQRAVDLGIEVDGRMSEKTISKLIDEKLNINE